jgi:hypothetical protein
VVGDALAAPLSDLSEQSAFIVWVRLELDKMKK